MQRRASPGVYPITDGKVKRQKVLTRKEGWVLWFSVSTADDKPVAHRITAKAMSFEMNISFERDQSCDHAQQGGLAGPVGALQPIDAGRQKNISGFGKL